MSLNAASVELSNALKTLTLSWEAVRDKWNDPVAQAFEADYWGPLEIQVKAALQAMDRLTPVLLQARQECS